LWLLLMANATKKLHLPTTTKSLVVYISSLISMQELFSRMGCPKERLITDHPINHRKYIIHISRGAIKKWKSH
jgi:hypothetical protein